jgi:hypothetical protein
LDTRGLKQPRKSQPAISNYRDPKAIRELILKDSIEFDNDPNHSMFIQKKGPIYQSLDQD